MNKKIVSISYSAWEKLSKIKIDKDLKSLSEVLDLILKEKEVIQKKDGSI